MTRAELMARISSQELSAWMVLERVRAEELQDARDAAESGDGEVTGRARQRGIVTDEGEDDGDLE